MLSGLAMVAVVLLLAISLDLGLPGQELLGTLRFHIAAAVLALSLLLALAGARFRALGLLGLVLLSAGQGVAVVMAQQEGRSAFAALTPKASFEVLSFNVLFDNPAGDAAARYVASSGADVVTLMEADGIASGFDAVTAQYPYRLGCDTLANCDLAIFSRTPLTDTHKEQLRGLDRLRLFIAKTVIGGQSVTLVAAHLSKPYFDDISRIELTTVNAFIAGMDGPVLLMGDFNSAAWSSRVANVADALDLIPPPSYPGTWPVELAPFGAPIDNMFTRGPALIRTIETTPEAFGSNHLGLRARIDLF